MAKSPQPVWKEAEFSKELALALFLSFHDVKAQKDVKCKKPEKCLEKVIGAVDHQARKETKQTLKEKIDKLFPPGSFSSGDTRTEVVNTVRGRHTATALVSLTERENKIVEDILNSL